MNTPGQQHVGRAVRLLFTSDRGDVRLLSQQSVDMAITGFDVAPDQRPGDFVEVRDEAGRRLSRVPVHTGLETSVEVFPEEHGGTITRVPRSGHARAFTVVVPASAEAASVAVIRVRRPSSHATQFAKGVPDFEAAVPAMETTELASFSIDR